MFPYLIAGAIGYAVAKIFEDDKTPKYADGGLMVGQYEDLIDLAKESDYNTFLDEASELSKYYILYRGMDSWDEWTDDSFFGDFLSHAKEYGEYVDGIIVNSNEILYFDNYTFNQLRKNITKLILPSKPMFFEAYNEYKQDFVEKLKEIYKPYFDEGKLSDAMMYLNYDEDYIINFIFNYVFNSTENFEEYAIKKDKDFFVPLLTYYAKNKGYNIISFYGSDFGGSDEFVVNDISKYTTLSDIWKSVDGNNPDELFNISDDYADGGELENVEKYKIFNVQKEGNYINFYIENNKIGYIEYYYYGGSITEHISNAEDEFYMAMIKVYEEYRGKNYSEIMIEYVKDYAKSLGATIITLRVSYGMGFSEKRNPNYGLEKIYLKNGFNYLWSEKESKKDDTKDLGAMYYDIR